MTAGSWSDEPKMLDVDDIQRLLGVGRDAANQFLRDHPDTVEVGRGRRLISRTVLAVNEGVHPRDAQALRDENVELRRRLDRATAALTRVAADAAGAAGDATSDRPLRAVS